MGGSETLNLSPIIIIILHGSPLAGDGSKENNKIHKKYTVFSSFDN